MEEAKDSDQSPRPNKIGGCLAPHWPIWEEKGADAWVVEVLKEGYRIPFLAEPPLAPHPIPFNSYGPASIKGQALEREVASLLEMEAVERVPSPDPGFYSRLFVVLKASGSWRPVIDLKKLNGSIKKTRFRMETVQSVLSSIRRNDWMVSIDLKEAYLQIPVHPESRKFLRFVTNMGVFQFRTLCFGLSTAPQVFTRIMAPVSKILHSMKIRLLRYLDDWLLIASSKEECLRARNFLIELCLELGIVINMEKSSLIPSQEIVYLGMILNSQTLRAFPTAERRKNVTILIEEFLSSGTQPAFLWQKILGHLASLSQLVPGGRLRMRSLQITLRKHWNFEDRGKQISWNQQCLQDLLWWAETEHLSLGCSLQTLPPDLAFWSDASDEGWGAHLSDQIASGLWSEEEKMMSINMRELRAAKLGLQEFQEIVQDKVVALFIDNTTAVAYLRNQGGTMSHKLNQETQEILRWSEENGTVLRPQFLLGSQNVIADSLSRPNQIQGAEWTLCQEVVDRITRRWPATIDLFATSLNHRFPVYFAPLQDPMSAGTDSLLQNWENLQGYAFPPFPLIRKVLNKMRQTRGCHLTLIAPFWPQKEWFPDLLELLVEPPLLLPRRRDLLRQPHFHRFHLNPQGLQLHAWRLSSNSPNRKASLREWLNNSPLREGNPLI